MADGSELDAQSDEVSAESADHSQTSQADRPTTVYVVAGDDGLDLVEDYRDSKYGMAAPLLYVQTHRKDHVFCVPASQMSDRGFSIELKESGALRISVAQTGEHVITYSPAGWMNYRNASYAKES
jgi:hypothetical protein